MSAVMDGSRIERSLARIAHEILERNRDLSDVALVGIRTAAMRSAMTTPRSCRTSPA